MPPEVTSLIQVAPGNERALNEFFPDSAKFLCSVAKFGGDSFGKIDLDSFPIDRIVKHPFAASLFLH